MADMNQIHTFAMKWLDKFRDQGINYIELVDHYMADDCAALGFEMDCGHAFERVYGKAVYDNKELDKVIDDITDIPLLGSAIYSRWRYYNHWAYDASQILEPQNRAWFITALSRLASLSSENPAIFKGTIKKIRIVSNNISYGPRPEPEDEVEQHLTVNTDGRVWFSTYVFGDGIGKYRKSKTKNFSIDKSNATELLDKVAAYFSREDYTDVFATDIGIWEMELTNTEGKTYKFQGSLCADFDADGIDLSDLIRDSLGLPDLYAFDGNDKPDKINRIVLDYHRVTKIKPKEVPEGAAWEFVTWDYAEQLIIDREKATLEHIQNIGTGCKVSRKYEVEGGIESLLDDFDAEDLFGNIVGNPDDVVENPNETKDYRITIDYKKNPQKIITGSFDKNGLPDDFKEFADAVYDFMRFYGLGEILDPSVYSKAKRRATDYIYCSVVFEDGQKTYYYLADDDSIEVDDFVIVPAGKDNHEAIVNVVGIEYFPEDKVPLPVEKTKHIIRKCTDEEIESIEETQSEAFYCPAAKKVITSDVCYELWMCLNGMMKLSLVPEVEIKDQAQAEKICNECPRHKQWE